MKKRKVWQHSLWGTALLVTALFCHTPFGLIRSVWLLIFFVLVLLPQVIALILQFREVRERYIAMIDRAEKQDDKHAGKPLSVGYGSVTINTYAMLKSQGINPNRAGPFGAFA